MSFTVYSDFHYEIAFTNMSHHLTQGPSCSTQNSQQAGIADRILSFARRSPPSDQAALTGIPTVVQTLTSLVPLLDSPTEGGFCIRLTCSTQKETKNSQPRC